MTVATTLKGATGATDVLPPPWWRLTVKMFAIFGKTARCLRRPAKRVRIPLRLAESLRARITLLFRSPPLCAPLGAIPISLSIECPLEPSLVAGLVQQEAKYELTLAIGADNRVQGIRKFWAQEIACLAIWTCDGGWRGVHARRVRSSRTTHREYGGSVRRFRDATKSLRPGHQSYSRSGPDGGFVFKRAGVFARQVLSA